MKVIPKNGLSDEVILRVLRKQIDLLYRNQTYAILMTITVVMLMFLHLHTVISQDQLTYWGLLLMASMFIRMSVGWLYWRDKYRRKINLKRAENLYLIGVVSTGTFFSMLSIALFPILDFKGQLILFLVVTGFASGAYTTMAYLKSPILIYVVMLLVSLSIAIYKSDIPGAQDVAIAMILYMLIVIRSAFLFYRNTYNMLSFQELSVDRENELLLQREKANSANLAKSEFMSRMSHELRTPLNAILGLSELQIRDRKFTLAEKQLSRAQKIAKAGKHLLAIVNDVLDLSRIETGSIDVNIQSVDLYGVIQHSMALVEDKAVLRKIIISSVIVQSEIRVMADENRLKQVIVNLLDNAIKYNKQGGNVSINVNILDNNKIRLNIVDTGHGLHREDIVQLFVPFSRLNAGDKGIDGTGIGLSLSKELVELMGGSIGVNSRPGEGSCFWIELPYVSVINVTEVFNSVETLDFEKLYKVNVLLVEDNLVNSEVAVDMLETMGISADVAYDGERAIEMFNQNQYSLILMDCEMPVLDGFSTTKAIRKIERELQKTPVPIIALTAHAISGSRDKCIESGMDDFLSKPFTMDELYSTLNSWLSETNTDVPLRSVAEDNTDINEAVLNDFICDSTVLDYTILFKIYQKQKKSKSKLLNRVINIYLEQSAILLSQLAEAFQTSNLESIRLTSHTLKSSSMNVGAIKFSELCRNIEQLSEQGVIEKSLVQQVISDYVNVEKALNDVLFNSGAL